MSHRYEDPGWPWAQALLAFIPFAAALQRRRVPQQNFLRAMRGLFLALASSPVLLLFVLYLIRDTTEQTSAVYVVLVCVAGVLSLGLSEYMRTRLRRAETEQEIVGGYRAIFFLRYAVLEAVSLGAFVLFFLDGTGLDLYVLGLLFAEVGFMRLAPTKAAIARDQRLIPSKFKLGRLLTTAQGVE